MVHNPGPGPSVSGPDTSGWRTYQQRQAPSPDHTRHCPLCEDHARRAAAAEVREDAAYAALEWLRLDAVKVENHEVFGVASVLTVNVQESADFYSALSAAVGQPVGPREGEQG